ncbi:hypothetical protein LINPERHAP2_LOCUS2258 [Linum perenne]
MSQSQSRGRPNMASHRNLDNPMVTRASQSSNILTERNQTENTNLASKKRTRGATMCKEVWWLPQGDKIKISFNSDCQPIEDNATKLTNFLGSLSRKSIYAPLRYEDWRLVPKEYKDNMWSLIEGKFEVDLLSKSWIMNSLSKKWKDFKSKVRASWEKHKIRDERVCDQDWEWLLKFWKSDKAGERRRVAKENRKNLPSGHTMGTKSCARVRHEMRLAAPGKEEPSRADVYIATHIRRDGKPLNEEVACYIEKMKEIQTHLPTSGDDHGPNDVYSQVLGRKKSRSTSTYGLGSTRGGKNSRMSIVREALEAKKSAEEEVQRVQQEIGKLREGQTKILALIQKNNPDLNLDDVVASPIRDDIDLNHNFIEDDSNLVQQEDNLGVGPFLAMLQSSSETSETDANNETTNSLMDIFVPLSRNIPIPKESTAATSNDPFLHYMLNTYQEKDSQQQPMDMTEEGHNVTNSSTQGLTYCYLRSLNQPNVDVAKGSIVSKNPKRIVGDVELGGGFYEIFVEVPMKPDEPLVRPYGSFSVIGDVTGRTIAWPSILVNRLYVDTLFS